MPISELLAILGNAEEFIGSLAVLVTLVNLSIQTRNINRQSQAWARCAFVESMAEINMTIGRSKQSSSVWCVGLDLATRREWHLPGILLIKGMNVDVTADRQIAGL